MLLCPTSGRSTCSAVTPEDPVSLHEQLLMRFEIVSLTNFEAGGMFPQATSILPPTNSAVWSWVIDRVWTAPFAQL